MKGRVRDNVQGGHLGLTMLSVIFLELFKVYLLVSYSLLALGQPAPSIPAVLVFISAFVLGRWLGRRGGRVAFYWIIMMAGVSVSFILFYAGDGGWVPVFASAASATAYWFRGAWLAKQNPDHRFCLARFDEGLWVAIIVYSLAALLGIANPLAGFLLYPLGFFSIISLGSSKTGSRNSMGFPDRHWSPAAPSQALVFMTAIIGISLLVPLLVGPTLWTSGKLMGATVSMFQFLAGIMDRLFALDPAISQSSGQPLFSSPPATDGDPEAGILTWLFLLVLLVIALLSVVFLLVAGLVRIFRYLAATTGEEPESDLLKEWLHWIGKSWSGFWKRFMMHTRQQRLHSGSALALYLRYQSLGRMVGCTRRSQETARQYAQRLEYLFPASARHAGFVVVVLEKEYYGAQTPDAASRKEITEIAKKTRCASFIAERLQQTFRRVFPGKADPEIKNKQMR
ncbi:MAG: DUF4129 domain-containing protein [Clostridia bacterium]|jgi:hypothetical protein